MKSMDRVLIAAGMAVFCLGATPAPAQHELSEDWTFELTPYIWFVGLDYEVEVRDIEVSGDVDFDELFDAVDFAALAAFQARKGRWSVWTALDYFELSESDSVGRFERKFEIELDYMALEVGGAYMVYAEGPQLELLAGARYTDIDIDLELEALLENPARKASGGDDWVDPFVGARVGFEFTDWWYSTLRADVGGFDVGSELTWQVLATMGFRLSESIDLRVGYKHVDIDYEDGGNSADLELSGPIAGLTFRF